MGECRCGHPFADHVNQQVRNHIKTGDCTGCHRERRKYPCPYYRELVMHNAG
jgi:hypothetical protein